MSVRLLYFSWVRERIGLDGEELSLADLTAHSTDVAGLIRLLSGRSPGHAAAFADPSRLRVAINQQYCGFDARVGDGDEVAFFPPVTGG